MKTLYAIALISIASFVSGCADDPNQLLDHNSGSNTSSDPESTAAGETNTFDHIKESTGGENGITDVHQRAIDELAIGTPEDVAHLHSAQKVSYASLGKMLTDFGTSTAGGKAGSLTAGTLYTSGKGALGAPIFSSRTPEMSTPSTSALAKQMDIFVAAAPDIINNLGTSSKRCPGVSLVTAGKFTADGIACLTGKPASDEYVNLANQMVSDVGDPTTGAQIAVATMLAAAHISE
jgi:hypothetical protein